MQRIRKIVIYKCLVNGHEIRKSCVYNTDGSMHYGSYEDGINATMKLLEQKGLDSKTGMSTLVDEGFVKIETEEDFLKNKIQYEKELNDELSFFARVAEEENNRFAELEDEEIEEENYYIDSSEEIDSTYDPEIEDKEIYYEDGEEIIVEEDNSQETYKNNHTGLKIAAGVIGLLIGAGLWASCNHKSKTGEMTNSTLPTNTISNTTTDNDDNMVVISDPTDTETHEVIAGNNDLYNEYSFSELLSVTTNEFQKSSMINLSASLNGFNGVFADNYTESGNDIRAALKFDEAVALQQAYNTYSIDEVRAYFNGSEIHAENLSNAYKDASLQLMGAHVLETRENPVDMSILIDSEEGRAFYNRYHEMFLAAKEATGSEKTRLINVFYDAVRSDFPITNEVRTSGISHADDRNSLKDYQLAVTPMIAASEILFEQVDGLHKLEKDEINFLNDIGLCNHADDKFERIETIMLASYEDNTNPLYEQYRNAIIKDLTDRSIYVIDNAHRELANLRSFQIKVNGNNNSLGRYTTMYSDTRFVDSTYTYQDTRTWEETHTDTRTETTREERDIPEDQRNRIDRDIDNDNRRAREDGQRQADENAREIQNAEDRNADKVREEVDQHNQDIQDRIDDANKKIEDGQPVTQDDLGDNIHIDDNHRDDNGNLDDSVRNITTDPRGADKPLPNPEDTEEEFNRRTLQRSAATVITNSSVEVEETTTENQEESSPKVEEVDTDNGHAYIEYDEDYGDYDEDGNLISASKAVDKYIESLVDEIYEESNKVYTK